MNEGVVIAKLYSSWELRSTHSGHNVPACEQEPHDRMALRVKHVLIVRIVVHLEQMFQPNGTALSEHPANMGIVFGLLRRRFRKKCSALIGPAWQRFAKVAGDHRACYFVR